MKRAILALVAVLSLTLLLTPAFATNVPPGTNPPGVVPTTLGAFPAGTLVASTGVVPYSFGTAANPTKNTGLVIENVYRDGAGFLFFAFQFQIATGDLERLTSGDWDNSISIDAEQFNFGGEVAAVGVDRNGLGTVGINWAPPVTGAGSTSTAVILYTNASTFVAGAIGLIDTGSSPSIPGYVAATPEPATLSLLGFGLVGLGTLRKKLRK